MLETAECYGLDGSLNWLCDMAQDGSLPTRGPVDDTTHIPEKAKGWGTVELIGVGTRTYHLPVIRDQVYHDQSEFWTLPEDQQTQLEARRHNLENVRQFDVLDPHVRYQRQTAANTGGCSRSQPKPTTKVSKHKSRDVISDSDCHEADMSDDELKTSDRRHSKKPGTEHVDDGDDRVTSQKLDDDTWGVDFSMCRPKHFADPSQLLKHSLCRLRDQ
jgi:hypothetical protein